ncbi:MAG: hypothetical protein ACJAUY_001653 [Cognaticolwellia sp.]|jgi:hypothetical protein
MQILSTIKATLFTNHRIPQIKKFSVFTPGICCDRFNSVCIKAKLIKKVSNT